MSKINGKLVLALLAGMMTAGCAVHAGLYPVGGPSEQASGAIPSVKITGPFNSGNISVKLNDGEVCKGRWNRITATSANALAPVWDTVYGQGFYVAHVLGTSLYAQSVLTGNRGTTLTIEMYRRESGDPNHITPLQGVAKDNHGNIYKLAY